jgi:CheY-like chemotaxis protein
MASVLLIVEDQPRDLRTAKSAALLSGFTDIECRNSSSNVLELLKKRVKEGEPLPDAILVDLDLGLENGYEVLRFRYSNPELMKIPVLVWTHLLEKREICELFGVKLFIEKADGAKALRKGLDELRLLATQESGESVE